MKNHEAFAYENAATNDLLLETIVSAQNLVLQMRILAGSDDFAGHAETEWMADTLGHWVQIASSDWCDAEPGAKFWPDLH